MYKIYTKNPFLLFRYFKKIPLFMRLTTLLLVAAIVQVSAKSFAQKISLSEKNAPLSKVFKKISQQSGYDFFVTGSMLKSAKPVTINVTNAELSDVLTAIFKDQPVSFNIADKTITITPKISTNQNIKAASPIVIHGVVLDEKGLPLKGAYVRKKSSGIVALTDEAGKYSLHFLDSRDSIVVSYIGYVTQTIGIDSREEINITLKVAIAALQEVSITTVSTGYQTLDKERVTGSFGKPDMQIFNSRLATNDIVGRLDGLVPGLNVLTGPGKATVNRNGNGSSQQQSIIRGKSTIALPTDPLYVVNGVQVTDMSAINPEDISDITVLKDAAATAIWGAKAANGVIVIVTKKGNNRRLNINYSANFNFQGKPDFDYMAKKLLTSSQFIQAAKETFSPSVYPYATLSNSVITPHEQILYNQNLGLISTAQANTSLDSLANISNISQVKDLWFRNAYTTNHTVSAAGGNGLYNFYSSLSYTNIHSNALGETNSTYRINLSQDITPNKWLKITLNTSLNNNISSAARPISIGASFLPYQLFQDGNGNNIKLNYLQGLSVATTANYQARSRINLDYSPLDEINAGYTKNNNLTINTTANVVAKIWKGLSFDGTYGYQKAPGSTINYDDISEYSQRRELLAFTVAPTTNSVPVYYLPTTGGKYQNVNNDQRNWTVRNQLVYNSNLRKDRDRITVQLGQEAQEQYNIRTAATARGYNQDLLTSSTINYTTLSQGIFGAVSSGRSILNEVPFTTIETTTRNTSYLGLLNYTFNQKYSFDGSIRADHSNLFGNQESGQKKPAYSLGGKWQIARENFMKDVSWINDLGMRFTYGVAGNSPYLGAGSNFDILRVTTNNTTGNALYVSTVANDKLTWEATHTYNLGFDFAIFKSRLSGSLDLYQKNTTDMLGTVNVNPFSGSSTTTGNLGDMRNRGIELSLRSVNVQSKDFGWSTSLTFSYNNNKLLSYTDPSPQTLTDSYRYYSPYIIGYNSSPVFAYRYAGLDNLGDPQIKLANGTVTKTIDAATGNDMVYMGSTLPKFNGGFSNVFRYKKLSLSANMIYSLGAVMRRDANLFYTGRLTGSGSNYIGNISAEFANRWKAPSDEANTNIPSYVANQGTSFDRRNINYYTFADINVVSASYIKLRDITLSYNIPVQALKMSMRLFVQSGNFMVWKANKYDIDLEYAGTLPAYSHTYTIGLNASF